MTSASLPSDALHFRLLQLVRDQNLEAVSSLLQDLTGAMFDYSSVKGHYCSPLHYAVQNDDVSMVELLISRGFDVHGLDNRGHHCLFEWAGSIEILNLLLKQGVNPHHTSTSGTRLIFAMGQRGHPHLAQAIPILVSHGVDLFQSLPDGRHLLHESTMTHHIGLLKLLLSYQPSFAVLNQSSKIDPTDSFQLIPRTPLMCAIHTRNPEAISLFLEAGADPLAQNQHGEIALDHARKTNNDALIKVLEGVTLARQELLALSQTVPPHTPLLTDNNGLDNTMRYSRFKL